jgi:hypothetical protein
MDSVSHQPRQRVVRQLAVDAFNHPRVGVPHRGADELRLDALASQPGRVRASQIVGGTGRDAERLACRAQVSPHI